jgi:hypothetical protein
MSKNLKAAVIIILPLAIVIGEIIIKISAGKPFLQDVGTILGALGLGQIIPFLVFESLIIEKIYSFKTVYSISGKVLHIEYPLEVNDSNLNKIDNVRTITLLVFVGCLLTWLASVSFSTNITSSTEYSIPSMVFGLVNCIIAWFYLLGL